MKKKKTKFLALVLICTMAVALLAACSPQADPVATGDATTPGAEITPGTETAPTAAQPGRTLYIAVSNSFGTLHPHGVVGAAGFIPIMRSLYDALFTFRQDGTMEMLLVEEIEEISEIQYIFHLRRGVTFSNGNPFTAHDIYFTMNYVRDHPRLNSEVRHVCFDNTRVIDDYTFELWLTHFDVGAFHGFVTMYVLNAASYDADYLAYNPIGTGPYRVVDFVIGSHLILEVRDDFWGPRPAVERIHFRILEEPAQRVNAIQTGIVHHASIPVRDIDFVESLGYSILQVNNAVAMGVFFNLTPGELLGTLAAREAIMHAINREAIHRIAFDGLGVIAPWPTSSANVDFEPRFAGMHPVYTAAGYDPERARALAEQEGLIGQTLRIITNGDPTWVAVAEIIQHNLSAIDINTQIINFDPGTYWAMMADESSFEIAIQVIAAPQPLALRHMNSYPRFFSQGWDNPDRDRYLELGTQGMGTADDAARAEILYEMLQIFMRNKPWFNLVDTVSVEALSPELSVIARDIDGSLRFKHWQWAE